MPVMPGMRMSSSTTDGFSLPTSGKRIGAVRAHAGDGAARQLGDEPLQPLARRQFVVDDEDAQGGGVHSV